MVVSESVLPEQWRFGHRKLSTGYTPITGLENLKFWREESKGLEETYLKFSSGGSVQECFQNRELELCLSPRDESLEVGLAYRANWVDIGRRAVISRIISTERSAIPLG